MFLTFAVTKLREGKIAIAVALLVLHKYRRALQLAVLLLLRSFRLKEYRWAFFRIHGCVDFAISIVIIRCRVVVDHFFLRRGVIHAID